MFNLLYCSKNFRKTARSFWNYYPDKPNSVYTYPADTPANEIQRKKRFRSIYESESFDYKTKLINVLPGVDDDVNSEVTSESEDIKNCCTSKKLKKFYF